jgi:pyruvate/2-oxoglutarate dehydrogenase complex dihydrolipoamide acyltransferase (E2) component
MFGMGAEWAVGIVPLHTLCLTVGGITQKPCVIDGRIEPREVLAVTASIDHDIVDGAPAARFARRLREIVEGAEVLRDVTRPKERR